jgi:hypothetical protein
VRVHSRLSVGQQVIMQLCLSPHFGVIGERLLTADETFPFIGSIFTRRRVSVKGIRALFVWLASRGFPQSGGGQPGVGKGARKGVTQSFSAVSAGAGRERISAGFRFGGRKATFSWEDCGFLAKLEAFPALRNCVRQDPCGVFPVAQSPGINTAITLFP